MRKEFLKWGMTEIVTPQYPDGVISINEDNETQRPVAIVPLSVWKHPNETEAQRNDARLITASPELLKASQCALKSIAPAAPIYQLLISVIEKATGVKYPSPEINSKSYVCEICGSSDIQYKVWVDANSNAFISDTEGEKNSNWCNCCQEHTAFVNLTDFKMKL